MNQSNISFQKIKLLIVEDDVLLAEDLKRSLKELFPNEINDIYVEHSFISAIKSIEELDFQITLLDLVIGKDQDAGLKLSEKINLLYPKVPQIFMTGLPDEKGFIKVKPYLINGSFYYFLKKPFTDDLLKRSIELVLSVNQHLKSTPSLIHFKPLNESHIWVTTAKGRYEKLLLRDLKYIQSDDHYLKAYLADRQSPVVFKFNLRDFYTQLLSSFENFFPLDRSKIINLHFASKIENNLIYLQETPFSIPRSNKAQLLQTINIISQN